MRFFWITASIVFLLDRVTKYFILKIFPPGREIVIHLCSYFNIVKVWNKGVAFGLFSRNEDFTRWIFIVITILMLIISYLWAKKISKVSLKENKLFLIALGMLFGGGLGNIVDRLIWGRVLDFIDLHIGVYHWPAFNVADIGITFSLIMLILFYKSGNHVSQNN
jgi:signal peptidase II